MVAKSLSEALNVGKHHCVLLGKDAHKQLVLLGKDAHKQPVHLGKAVCAVRDVSA